jgi:hypothetical protein
MGVQNYILKTYSKVVAEQIEKECIARDATLERYLALIQRMENYFRRFSVEHIERTKNTEADELAKVAAKKKQHYPRHVFPNTQRFIYKIVELEPRIVNVIQGRIGEHRSWHTSIIIINQIAK